MIEDEEKASMIARDWQAVRKLSAPYVRMTTYRGRALAETRTKGAFNLPFVLAYSVLGDVLSELRNQGLFECRGREIGRLMKDSKSHLSWRQYDIVHAGKIARDSLVHQARLCDKVNCLKYIEAIETELDAWGVI